ncbi:MAG: ribosome-associated translation inhibitor RaiA [Porphyromonas sp.]|nr:ribosome-associated translation inhibitor RaiA [Porphyromonas sp.]
MDIRIQALHFEATETLQAFIHKKVEKLKRFSDELTTAEVILKVTKPEVKNNKEASIKLLGKGHELFADKVADSFEEAIDLSIDALKRQLEKHKEQH